MKPSERAIFMGDSGMKEGQAAIDEWLSYFHDEELDRLEWHLCDPRGIAGVPEMFQQRIQRLALVAFKEERAAQGETTTGGSMKKLGDYILSARRKVAVFVDSHNRDGRVDYHEKITVGLNFSEWSDCLAVLLHEAFELSMSDHDCHLTHTTSAVHTADCYVFLMTHPQFSQVCDEVGCFLASVVPDLYPAWRLAAKNRRAR